MVLQLLIFAYGVWTTLIHDPEGPVKLFYQCRAAAG